MFDPTNYMMYKCIVANPGKLDIGIHKYTIQFQILQLPQWEILSL